MMMGSYALANTTSLSLTLTIPSSYLSSHCRFSPSPHFCKTHLITGTNLTRTLSFTTTRCTSSPTVSTALEDEDDDSFVVFNFYHLTFIKDPHLEVARHSSFIEGLDIHGRIYFNEQGINAQFSGPSRNALTYVDWVRKDCRFSDILVQVSPSSGGHAFPRLKLRYKPSLVQFDSGVQDFPLLEPSMRATPLSPAEWKERLKSLHGSDATSNGDHDKACILLDVRNGYEWDIGHFNGAQRPEVDCFRSTSFGLSDAEVVDSDPLVNVDRDKTDILMYCTGGIRCDVYSTILRQKGFKNLYTLKGGVSHYLQTEGPEKWTGNLFVFDSRLSLPPSVFNPEASTSNTCQGAPGDDKFAKCHTCGSEVHHLRHRNCANIDCNLLYLSCRNCVEELRGCCCIKCTTAPRLRPVLSENERYRKWHIYRDEKLEVGTGMC